jgi:hypothetical protein
VPCKTCGKPFTPSKLLFPVEKKNYQDDPFIAREWEAIRAYLEACFVLTIFGYSAPTTDVEAMQLLKDGWGPVSDRNMEQTEMINRQVPIMRRCVELGTPSSTRITMRSTTRSSSHGSASIQGDRVRLIGISIGRRSSSATILCGGTLEDYRISWSGLSRFSKWRPHETQNSLISSVGSARDGLARRSSSRTYRGVGSS